MIAFVDDHRGAYGVEPICNVLPIAPSTYHEHVVRRANPAKLPAPARRDAALKIGVQPVFAEGLQVYGVCKVWRQLRREGIKIARCTAAPLMKAQELPRVVRGRREHTALADKAVPCPRDHVNRHFRAPAQNRL